MNTSSPEMPNLSLSNECVIENVIRSNGFDICHKVNEQGREAESISYEDLGLSIHSIDFLKKRGILSLWKHQYLAIKEAKAGKNVCVTTSTSSGKTEIFQLSAIEVLEKQPDSKILAVYPMKALNRQQVERWEKTGFKVGKIDGDTAMSDRIQILQNCQIAVMTPDVIHAFLLGSLNDRKTGKIICQFIRSLSMLIIDELHLYKGIFGTNSAYLFRRLNHIRMLLRKDHSFTQYITASATLPSAVQHSFNITGVRGFVEIGEDQDASPMSEKTFYYIEKNEEVTGNGSVIDLVYELSNIEDAKSITFVEGRQRAGDMAYLLDKRIQDNAEVSGIYPYRAGYEAESVDLITEKLHSGDFKGIVSTSALEIGIDIDGLNIAIIADMPHDKNSYQQRIGRVGRFGCDKSYVIVVRTDSFASQLLFDEFDYDMDKVLPNYEPALYLEDENVQDIQALCHVGEHDKCEYAQWKGNMGQVRKFDDEGCFPPSFVKLCLNILTGQTSQGYDNMRCDAPHFTYPLRFWDKQYDIVAARDERKPIPQEQISREQLGTEGYEQAVRNTMYKGEKIRERVVWLNLSKREIYVKREYNNYLSTSPAKRKYIIPNFNNKDYSNKGIYYGDTKIYNLRVREHCNIYGYYEKKNKNKEYHRYENVFRLPVFYTTGTVFFHPCLNTKGVSTSNIARILFETFLSRNAFDRNDINYIGGKLFNGNDILQRDDRFVAIYDANALNITSRIMDDALLKDMFAYLSRHKDVIVHNICPEINQATIEAIETLCQSIMNSEADTNYQDLGLERRFKMGTEVFYLSEHADDPDVDVKQKCQLVGNGNEKDTYNVLLNGKLEIDIPIDRIEATENTEFEIRTK